MQETEASSHWHEVVSRVADIQTHYRHSEREQQEAVRVAINDLSQLPHHDLKDLFDAAMANRVHVHAGDPAFLAGQMVFAASERNGVLRRIRDPEQEAVWRKIRQDLADIDSGRKTYDDLGLRPARPLPFPEIPGICEC